MQRRKNHVDGGIASGSASQDTWPTAPARPVGHSLVGPFRRLRRNGKIIPAAVLALLARTGRELRLIRLLFTLTRGHLWFVPIMAGLALLSSLFEGISLTLIIPLVQHLDKNAPPGSHSGPLAFFYDIVAAIPPQSRLVVILGAILVAVMVKSAVSYSNVVVLGFVYGRLSHSLRARVFQKIIGRPLAELERETSGKLLNILNNETWRATDALNHLFTLITSTTTMAVFISLLVLLSWRLSLVALLCMALIPPLILLVTRRAKKIGRLGHEANEALAQRTWAALNGLRVIHAFGREGYEIDRYNHRSDRVRHIFLRMILLSMTTGPITETLVTAVVAILALLVDASQLGIGTLVGFLAILYRLQPRMLSFTAAQASLLGLHASMKAVVEVLTERDLADRSRPARKFHGLSQSIRLENVSFTYNNAAKPSLVDVSFEAPKGSMTAIVGASGAGKSTMLDLLLHFQVPTSGCIVVDGVPLNEFDQSSWRSHIAVVSQDPYVFDDTVRANITYGRLDASQDDMCNAARLACAEDFIRELPLGYDTIVGERGAQLSGGQRQRIALARALIRNADILILDEATNALESLTEKAFQDTLAEFGDSHTVFVVAHRLATVEKADQIIVLDAGRVVERGTLDKLLRDEGPFYRMFASQAGVRPVRFAQSRARAT